MGKSASGKDTIYEQLLQDDSLGLHSVVPYTTRPIRAGEVNGREYWFTTAEQFEDARKGKSLNFVGMIRSMVPGITTLRMTGR